MLHGRRVSGQAVHHSCPVRSSLQVHPRHVLGWSRSVNLQMAATQTSASTEVAAEQTAAHSSRRAWHITKQGDMGSLKLVNEPMPALRPEDVLVEVKALGLNFADVFCCLGLYKAAPKGDFIPGLEFSGVVLQTAGDTAQSAGANAEHQITQQLQPQQLHQYKVGDRVLGVLRFGAFASHIAIPLQYLRPIPQTPEPWSFEEAAAYPVQTLTAAFGLYNCGGYQPGQAVLVQSAAGGVGLQALQILQRTDATVLGLVSSNDKVHMLNKQYGLSNSSGSSAAAGSKSNWQATAEAGAAGAEQHTGSQQQQKQPRMEFATRLPNEAAAREQIAGFLQRSGRTGYDVILDSLGPGPYFRPSYDALNPCGRHVIFGAGSLTPQPGLKLSLNPAALLAAPASVWGLAKLVWGWLNRPKLDVINMPGDNKGVIGFNLIWLYDRLDVLADLYDKVDALNLDPPVVGKVYEFEQLPEALAYLQSGRSIGKVVVAVKD